MKGAGKGKEPGMIMIQLARPCREGVKNGERLTQLAARSIVTAIFRKRGASHEPGRTGCRTARGHCEKVRTVAVSAREA